MQRSKVKVNKAEGRFSGRKQSIVLATNIDSNQCCSESNSVEKFSAEIVSLSADKFIKVTYLFCKSRRNESSMSRKPREKREDKTKLEFYNTTITEQQSHCDDKQLCH